MARPSSSVISAQELAKTARSPVRSNTHCAVELVSRRILANPAILTKCRFHGSHSNFPLLEDSERRNFIFVATCACPFGQTDILFPRLDVLASKISELKRRKRAC